MHLAIALFTVFATWYWGDWKNWRKYHPTMFYIATAGLLYEYLTRDFTLWVFHPDLLYSETITVIIYALVTMPLSILIFLSLFPQKLTKQMLYIAKWILIYASVELVLYYSGRISFQHGWNFLYSVLFDLMMFPMLRLHHVKPLWAYPLSIIIIISLILWFKVPLS